MSVHPSVHILLTHLSPEDVDLQVRHFQHLSPPETGCHHIVAYGGKREVFDQIRHPLKVFIEDPRLRGITCFQSYTEILQKSRALALRETISPSYYLLTEFDHLIRVRNYMDELVSVMDSHGLDLAAKRLVDCTSSNISHYLLARENPGFMRQIGEVSKRERKEALYHMLGTGFMISERAMHAFCEMEHVNETYFEIYIPSFVHHLGYATGNMVLHSDVYNHVEFTPILSEKDVSLLQAQGARHFHPVKDLAFWRRFHQAPAPSPAAG